MGDGYKWDESSMLKDKDQWTAAAGYMDTAASKANGLDMGFMEFGLFALTMSSGYTSFQSKYGPLATDGGEVYRESSTRIQKAIDAYKDAEAAAQSGYGSAEEPIDNF